MNSPALSQKLMSLCATQDLPSVCSNRKSVNISVHLPSTCPELDVYSQVLKGLLQILWDSCILEFGVSMCSWSKIAESGSLLTAETWSGGVLGCNSCSPHSMAV